MIRRQVRQACWKRRGATVVEMTAVLIVFLLLLFGIIEYCRFIFIRQLVVNAAREGARYAVVNTLESSVEADTKAWVKKRMAGLDTKVASYDCQVYTADATGTKTGTAGQAQFGQYVAVEIKCDYNPVLPSFLRLNKTIQIQTKALMYSEAN